MRRATSHKRQAFTLVEMLTVIGIIVLLVAILLPVVSAVRVKGHQADTMAMLSRIASGAESYNADFRAYPGPFSNAQVHIAGAGSLSMKTGGTIQFSKVTQAENFAVGLLGGLYNDSSSGDIKFDPDLVGNGPNSLNVRNPKKGRAYMDKVSLSNRDADPAKLWDYKDEAGDADDSPLPEFVDKFPDPMPILVMRAKPGGRGIVSNTTSYADQEQYDLNQIIGYTGKGIGVGREAPADEEFKPAVSSGNPADKIKHGLQTVRTTAVIDPSLDGKGGQAYFYPYDLYGFMRHPSMPGTPRQKDGFILISSGADRIYGTKDDAVYPASR